MVPAFKKIFASFIASESLSSLRVLLLDCLFLFGHLGVLFAPIFSKSTVPFFSPLFPPSKKFSKHRGPVFN